MFNKKQKGVGKGQLISSLFRRVCIVFPKQSIEYVIKILFVRFVIKTNILIQYKLVYCIKTSVISFAIVIHTL